MNHVTRRATAATSSPTNRRFRLALALLLTVTAATVLFPSRAVPHIVVEEPWHPVASAYLRGLFYANLEPVDWQLIAHEYEIVDDPDFAISSVYEGLAGAEALAGVDHSASIRAAIGAQDAAQLYRSSTRALSQLTRHYITQAGLQLDELGDGLEQVRQAQRIYRVFDRFVRATDPQAYSRLGRAWLELSTSAGPRAVIQRTSPEQRRSMLDEASTVIAQYLIANYEQDSVEAGARFEPLPATMVASGKHYEVPYWLPPGSDLNDQDPLPLLRLNFEALGIDETDLFLAAYGDMLFDSPEIFGDPARSLGIACSTCHNRSDINQRFFIPGISHQAGAADVDGEFFNPRFNDRRSDSLDIPSLRGIRFTAPYGRDGRFAGLRDFTRNVVVNEFAGAEPTPLMLDALVAYMFEFDWLPAPYLATDGTLNDHASAAARRGEQVFTRSFAGMGDRACSSCHIPGANFIDGLRHDIETSPRTEPGAVDNFFDTPTLINVSQTAPYMHDGSLASLGAVIDWFDMQFDLGLSADERADLTAYVETVGAADPAYEIFDEENTRFLLDWGELSTFLSTLDTLIPARDAEHADLLLRTVSKDLRVDAGGLVDLSQTGMVWELAAILDEISAAIAAADWRQAAALWDAYKALEAQYGPLFR